MGVAYILSLDRKDPGFDAAWESKTIPKHDTELAIITERLGRKSIYEFMSHAAQNDITPPEFQETVTPWFDAKVGIAWLTAVIAYIREHTSSIGETDRVLEQLEACVDILRKADGAGIKWHFWMDI